MSNDIRTLTLRFANVDTTSRFLSLARLKGYEPSITKDQDWYVLTTVFQNKTERSKFLAAWARDTIQIIGA